MAAKSPKLFQPTQLGEMALQHRMVLAPLTRFRNEEDGTPLDMAIEYYEQRASEPGTLLISEGQFPLSSLPLVFYLAPFHSYLGGP